VFADVLVEALQRDPQLAQRGRRVWVLLVGARRQQPGGQVDRQHLVQVEGSSRQVGILVHLQLFAAVLFLIDARRQLVGVQVLGDRRAIHPDAPRDLRARQSFGVRPQQFLDLQQADRFLLRSIHKSPLSK